MLRYFLSVLDLLVRGLAIYVRSDGSNTVGKVQSLVKQELVVFHAKESSSAGLNMA